MINLDLTEVDTIMKRFSFLPLLLALTVPFPEAVKVELFVSKPGVLVAFRLEKSVPYTSLERPTSGCILDGAPVVAFYTQQSSHCPPVKPRSTLLDLAYICLPTKAMDPRNSNSRKVQVMVTF